MIPILYSSIVEGTVPADYGIGALTDTLAAEVTEERNGIYELALTYAAQGIHAEDIKVDRYIKAQPNFTDAPQLFRIYKVGKAMNGRFEVNAEHVSYLLSGKPITSGTANNIVYACSNVLTPKAGGFTITTTKSTLGDFVISGPSSVRSWFGGKAGSLLDVYGGGEWHYNNFTATLMASRGADRGVTIRYGKNLTELNQEIKCDNLYTHVLSYYQPEGESAVTGNEIATGLAGNKRVLILNVTNEFQAAPDVQTLDDYSTGYISGHNLTVPESNFTLNFVQSGALAERVDLCDTVSVYFEALGISAKVKCIRVKWDVLKDRYIETEFGQVKASIIDTISGNDAAIAEASANAAEAKNMVSSKCRVFTDVPIPPYNVGDLWINNGTIYNCVTERQAGYINQLGETETAIYDGDEDDTVIIINGESHTAQFGDVATYGGEAFAWNGAQWISYEGFMQEDWNLATDYVDDSELEDSINKATELLTGGVGGNVVINYRDLTIGEIIVKVPYEILILCDADNLDDATQIWRWNEKGLGYTHDAGRHYDTAITIDEDGNGQINASMITTGSLDALKAKITNLTAAMFTGQTIVLGGSEDVKLEVQDMSSPPKTLVRINGNGLECFDAQGGSVVFDKNGMTGYSDASDKANTAIFWTHADQFHMKNSTVENEAAFGGKIRFVPIQTATNNGIAIVAVV